MDSDAIYDAVRLAIEQKNARTLKSLASSLGSKALRVSRKGYKELNECAYASSPEILKAFLQSGGEADVAWDARGNSALKQAAEDGDEVRAGILLDGGARVDWKAKGRKTALQIAMEDGRLGVASLLVQRGADADVPEYKDGDTVLKMAAERGWASFIRLALEHGADPNGKGTGRLSPLAIAVRSGQKVCARALLEGGADPNFEWGSKGDTVFKCAVDEENAAMMRLLCDFGADLDRKGSGRYTNFDYAARNGVGAESLLQMKAAAAQAAKKNEREGLGKALISLFKTAAGGASNAQANGDALADEAVEEKAKQLQEPDPLPRIGKRSPGF